jgi:hypothetical protein
MSTSLGNRIALSAMACLAIGVTGCCHIAPVSYIHVCPANVKAGLASIACQPMDTDFVLGQPAVKLSVDAKGKGLAYQWIYRNPSLQDTPLPEGDKRRDVATSTLTIAHPNKNDIGYYYCEIYGIDDDGFPTRTETRLASLGYAGPQAKVIEVADPPEQSLPSPGTVQLSSPCPNEPKYCSEVTFPLGGGTTMLASGGTHSINVVLIAASGATLKVGPSAAQIYIDDASVSPQNRFCATASGTQWTFLGYATHYYRYAIYFDCGQIPPPSQYPHVELIVQ